METPRSHEKSDKVLAVWWHYTNRCRRHLNSWLLPCWREKQEAMGQTEDLGVRERRDKKEKQNNVRLFLSSIAHKSTNHFIYQSTEQNNTHRYKSECKHRSSCIWPSVKMIRIFVKTSENYSNLFSACIREKLSVTYKFNFSRKSDGSHGCIIRNTKTSPIIKLMIEVVLLIV